MNSVLVPRDLLPPAPCDHPSIDDNHHNEFGGVTVWQSLLVTLVITKYVLQWNILKIIYYLLITAIRCNEFTYQKNSVNTHTQQQQITKTRNSASTQGFTGFSDKANGL